MSLIDYLGEASKEEVEYLFFAVFRERLHILLDILSRAVRLSKKKIRLSVM